MGYFSNGTEGETYRERYCLRCANNGDGVSGHGCAVWDAHLLYNGNKAAEAVLDVLIPVGLAGHNLTCAMFREAVK